MVSSPINLLHQIAPRRRSTPVSHCTFLDALSRLVLLAFPEARRCPADRPITGGEKKCPINPLSPPDSDHFPANSAFPRGMTIPRDMDRSQMLLEGRMPVPRGMSSPPYPGSIYRPIWDPSSSNTTKIFWGRHIMLSCPPPSPRPGTALLPPPPRGLYTTRKSTTNPFSDGRMKSRTARLDKTLETKYNQACATQSHNSRRPIPLRISSLPCWFPASRSPVRSSLAIHEKTSEVVVRHTCFMLSSRPSPAHHHQTTDTPASTKLKTRLVT